MRKCVRSQGCPEKVGHPSLPDHPHRYPTWLSWRGRQEKRGVGRAEKSPESENKSHSGRKHRAQVPQSPAHLQTLAHLRLARRSCKATSVCVERWRPSCPRQDSCRQLPATGVGLDSVRSWDMQDGVHVGCRGKFFCTVNHPTFIHLIKVSKQEACKAHCTCLQTGTHTHEGGRGSVHVHTCVAE